MSKYLLTISAHKLLIQLLDRTARRYGLLTEDNFYMCTEDGEVIVTEDAV